MVLITRPGGPGPGEVIILFFSPESFVNSTDLAPILLSGIPACAVTPTVVYSNAATQKLEILKETKGKSGIYRWVNTASRCGKTYVGSSVNLALRLRVYYDFSFLSVRVKKSKSRIYNAILKHGYSNFQLEILEYCTKENAINREQYYIDLLKPEYNLNSIAGSRLGSIHSEETKRKMSNSAQGRKLTEQTKN